MDDLSTQFDETEGGVGTPVPMPPIHPLAAVFPPMDDEAFRLFVEDIRANGQREPIVTYKGQVLDGVHRNKACIEIGITPDAVEYEGDSPTSFVVSMNIRRRQLEPSQLAMLVTHPDIYGPIQEEAAQRQVKALAGQRGFVANDKALAGQRVVADDKKHHYGGSNVVAGKLVGVNPTTVFEAKYIRDHGDPEQVDAITAGTSTVGAEYKKTKIKRPSVRNSRKPKTTSTATPDAKLRAQKDELEYQSMKNAATKKVPLNLPMLNRVTEIFRLLGELATLDPEDAAQQMPVERCRDFSQEGFGLWLLKLTDACEKRRAEEAPQLAQPEFKAVRDILNPFVPRTEATIPARERAVLEYLRAQTEPVTSKSFAFLKIDAGHVARSLNSLVAAGLAREDGRDGRTVYYRAEDV